MKKNLYNKTVLFIAPVFYNYEKAIIRQIESEGASVLFYPEREDGLLYKFVSNFTKGKLVNFQHKYYFEIFEKIKKEKIDYLFVIRGFLMPLNFIERIRIQFPDIVLIMHQWDSMCNNNYERYLDKFDKFFSFDPEDCNKYPVLKYLPNFYLPEYINLINHEPVYDMSFIGWAYSSRINFIKKIAEQLPGFNFFNYLYMPFSAYVKNIIRGIFLKPVKFKILSKEKVVSIVNQSKSILDIPDDKQSGYTFRTIDAMITRKKLVTTNTFIKKEKFYNENNILIIDKFKPEIDKQFFNKPFVVLNLDEYSLPSWVKTIFSNNDLNPINA